jgi:DNA-binding NtrC family response regulator
MTDSTKHLLLVEDEASLREVIAEQLSDRGFQVEQAESGEAALARLADFAFDVIVTDLRLPGIGGADVIEAAVERYPEIVAIVVTGYGTIKDAVETVKRGAWDFVAKPFQIDELMHVLEAALEQRRLKSENAYLRAQLEERYSFEGIIGKSQAMRKLFSLLETVAQTNSTVIITGETGTGKEVVARAIHHNGPRRTNRFVALNCSAIPETLLEAELFGHVRGAFTGAVGNRQGRLEQAHKGTLFLDEVGTMSPSLQMKLLRVLQEREFERVGESRSVKVDVRVIAATNTDLGQMVAEGQFREDLYYRLNVIPVQLPPLRDRKDDIPLLVQHFLEKYPRPVIAPRDVAPVFRPAKPEGTTKDVAPVFRPADSDGTAPDAAPVSRPASRDAAPVSRSASRDVAPVFRPALTVSQDAMRHLMAYHWPGNVRQLENTIERTVAFSAGRDQIDVEDLPTEMSQAVVSPVLQSVALPEDGIDLDEYVSTIERDLIRRSLERTGGNKGRAARLLNLKRTTLVERLKRLN